jgi:cyclophilin family peptidyl-prolyl cis-trans isomerase
LLLWLLFLSLLPGAGLAAPTCDDSPGRTQVRMQTTLGEIEILLCDFDAPNSVANFLEYVNAGSYGTTGFIHRSVQEAGGIFVIQGGGFTVDPEGRIDEVPTQDPIALEMVGLENLRGTLAMARTSEPDSATSQWFINVQDNPFFDDAEQGYAVFGEVSAGLDVVDAIAAQEIWALNPGVFSELPLVSYPDDGSAHIPYLVSVSEIVNLPEPAAALQGLAATVALALLGRMRGDRRARGPASTERIMQ